MICLKNLERCLLKMKIFTTECFGFVLKFCALLVFICFVLIVKISMLIFNIINNIKNSVSRDLETALTLLS